MISTRAVPRLCTQRCISCTPRPRISQRIGTRLFHASLRSCNDVNHPAEPNEAPVQGKDGAMSRRLAEMSDRNLEEGGRAARKAVEEAGFDEELKKQLLSRVEAATFKEENIQAFSQVNMPASAGKGTRDHASARPWSGTEQIEDASLRMLDDARKKIKTPSRIPSPQRIPNRVDTGRPKASPSTGTRLANARDRTSMYSYLKDENLSDKERDQMRKELKERFSPGARPMPTTLQGLSSLANERIEDAIARGQFKHLPRGQKLERDYNMSSPFLDTTEYFLNKMIKKQEIVPPWIEKQQEVVSTANKFRSRLRVEWRRHAARMIASGGGSVESQIQRAREYAAAEAIVNPSKKKQETLHAVSKDGHMSQISVSGEMKVPSDADLTQTVTNIKVVEESVDGASSGPEQHADIQVAESSGSAAVNDTPTTGAIAGGAVFPFRDAVWEATESSYHNAAITNLNTLTRSYNLMAPELAKKPYFRLDRELRQCYADVAPQLADAIWERANTPTLSQTNMRARKREGVLEHLTGSSAQVYDEQRPQYGFKEFWKDLFQSKSAS